VRAAWQAAGVRGELLFVDDGSRDATPERLAALRAADPDVKVVRLTRSFGHQAALAAGLRFARGDCVVTLDGDLQHPPERIPEMLEAWRAGADVVHTVRRDAAGVAGGWKERASRAFYGLMRRMSRTPIVPAGADFRLLDRRAVDALNELEEHFVFLRGLVPWLGFREAQLAYDVEARFAGRSKYRLRPMLRLALDGLVSFSVLPLRVIGLLGLVTAAFGVAFGVFALVAHLTGRVEASGWTSLVVLVLVFGGVQLLSLGVVSEYVGRIYEEVKRRPRYVIDRVEGVEWP
jgi:dolichol-phosphate mannosyltransferase